MIPGLGVRSERIRWSGLEFDILIADFLALARRQRLVHEAAKRRLASQLQIRLPPADPTLLGWFKAGSNMAAMAAKMTRPPPWRKISRRKWQLELRRREL